MQEIEREAHKPRNIWHSNCHVNSNPSAKSLHRHSRPSTVIPAVPCLQPAGAGF